MKRSLILAAVIIAVVAGIVYALSIEAGVALVLLIWGSFVLPVCWAWRRLFDELLERDADEHM